MLKLRDVSGKVWELPKNVAFVEVCDDQGAVCAVVHRLAPNRVAIYSPGDENFNRYLAKYKEDASKVIKV